MALLCRSITRHALRTSYLIFFFSLLAYSLYSSFLSSMSLSVCLPPIPLSISLLLSVSFFFSLFSLYPSLSLYPPFLLSLYSGTEPTIALCFSGWLLSPSSCCWHKRRRILYHSSDVSNRTPLLNVNQLGRQGGVLTTWQQHFEQEDVIEALPAMYMYIPPLLLGF